MIYFTSDTHFGHENVIRFTGRPYGTVAQMNHALVANINARVLPRDELYILGDYSFRITVEDAKAIREQIRCERVHLIPGNHDKDWASKVLAGTFDVMPPISRLKVNGHKYILSHYPLADWEAMERGSMMLHGHIHSRGSDYNELNRIQGIYRYDVGVDANGLRPVSIEEVDAWFAGVENAGIARWQSWVAPNPGPARDIARSLLVDELEREPDRHSANGKGAAWPSL